MYQNKENICQLILFLSAIVKIGDTSNFFLLFGGDSFIHFLAELGKVYSDVQNDVLNSSFKYMSVQHNV
jgi:hypothetical protein